MDEENNASAGVIFKINQVLLMSRINDKTRSEFFADKGALEAFHSIMNLNVVASRAISAAVSHYAARRRELGPKYLPMPVIAKSNDLNAILACTVVFKDDSFIITLAITIGSRECFFDIPALDILGHSQNNLLLNSQNYLKNKKAALARAEQINNQRKRN